MEQFDDRNPNRIREKSVYLLHLDAPRIIIISCVLVGVLIVAFLIGMNFSSDTQQNTRSLAQREMLFDPLPGEQARETVEPQGVESLVEQEGQSAPAKDVSPQKEVPAQTPAIASNQKAPLEQPAGETKDVLAQDTIKEVVPPAPAVKKEKRQRVNHTASKNADRGPVARHEVRSKSHRTVGVASKEERAERPASKAGYSIQVCAFDNRTRAQQEVSNLKRHRYDPYIETSRRDGKRYYRVRIGPITERSEAVSLLEEIQGMNRYNNSYLIRD